MNTSALSHLLARRTILLVKEARHLRVKIEHHHVDRTFTVRSTKLIDVK